MQDIDFGRSRKLMRRYIKVLLLNNITIKHAEPRSQCPRSPRTLSGSYLTFFMPVIVDIKRQFVLLLGSFANKNNNAQVAVGKHAGSGNTEQRTPANAELKYQMLTKIRLSTWFASRSNWEALPRLQFPETAGSVRRGR